MSCVSLDLAELLRAGKRLSMPFFSYFLKVLNETCLDQMSESVLAPYARLSFNRSLITKRKSEGTLRRE
jgi:hypothetical protein